MAKQKITALKDYFNTIYQIFILCSLDSTPKETRTEIQKNFRWFFSSNEKFRICFRD